MLTANQFSTLELARLQQDQGSSNSCGIYSACQALNMIYRANLSGAYWSNRIDRLPIPSILIYRLFRNGPTLPCQQINQLRFFARESGLPVPHLSLKSSNPDELRVILSQPDVAAIVTIGWIRTVGPKIMIGKSTVNRNHTVPGTSYHTMLVGAYDPGNISEDGILRPWGFVNSWSRPGKELFWISDGEFKRAWGHYTPSAGRFSLVIIRPG